MRNCYQKKPSVHRLGYTGFMLNTAYKIDPAVDLFDVSGTLRSEIRGRLLEAVRLQVLADAVLNKDSDLKNEKTFSVHLKESVAEGTYFDAFKTKFIFRRNELRGEIYMMVYQSFGWWLINDILKTLPFVVCEYSYWNRKDQDYLDELEIEDRVQAWSEVDKQQSLSVSLFSSFESRLQSVDKWMEEYDSLEYPSFDKRFRNMIFEVYCGILEKHGVTLDFDQKIRATAEFYVSDKETLPRLPYSERYPHLVEEAVDFCESYLAAHTRYELESGEA